MQHIDKWDYWRFLSINLQFVLLFFFLTTDCIFAQIVHLKFCVFAKPATVLFWTSSQEVLYISLAQIHSGCTAFCCCKGRKDRRLGSHELNSNHFFLLIYLFLERIMLNIFLQATWFQTQGEKIYFLLIRQSCTVYYQITF